MTVRALYPNLTPSLLLDFNRGRVVDPRVSFTRSSSATYTDAYGNLTEVSNNVPRLDHDPLTGVCMGLMIEGQRTNGITNPRFEGAVVGVIGSGGVLPTGMNTNATGLSTEVVSVGTLNGAPAVSIRIFGASAPGIIVVNFPGSVTGTTGDNIVSSAYVYVSGGSLTNIGTTFWSSTSIGGSGISTTPQLSSSVARLTSSRVSTGTANGMHFRMNATAGNPVDITLTFSQPQHENAFSNNFASSLILPPSGTLAASTRAAESLVTNSIGSWFNNTTGSVVVQGSTRASGTQPLVSLNDTTTNEQVNLYTSGTDPKFTVTDGGVTQTDLNGGTISANTRFKMGAAYAVNNFACSINGGTSQTGTGTLPTVTQMQIGTDAAGNQLQGYVERVAYYPERLTNSQLENLTK